MPATASASASGSVEASVTLTSAARGGPPASAESSPLRLSGPADARPADAYDRAMAEDHARPPAAVGYVWGQLLPVVRVAQEKGRGASALASGAVAIVLRAQLEADRLGRHCVSLRLPRRLFELARGQIPTQRLHARIEVADHAIPGSASGSNSRLRVPPADEVGERTGGDAGEVVVEAEPADDVVVVGRPRRDRRDRARSTARAVPPPRGSPRLAPLVERGHLRLGATGLEHPAVAPSAVRVLVLAGDRRITSQRSGSAGTPVGAAARRP